MTSVPSRGAGRWRAKRANAQAAEACAHPLGSAEADIRPEEDLGDTPLSKVGGSAFGDGRPFWSGEVVAWAERQLAELDALRAVFFEADAVYVDDKSVDALQQAAAAEHGLTLPNPLLISVLVYSGDEAIKARWRGGIQLRAVLPHGYPLDGCDHVVFWLEPDALAAGGGPLEDEVFGTRWQQASAELLGCGGEVLLPLAQCAADLVREWFDEASFDCGVEDDADEDLALALFEEELAGTTAQMPTGPPTLGRCAMFSHHIIAAGKRQAISQWAKQLGLGGLAKIGWPGVIIVEGPEGDVRAYVDALSRLRWKHFVVRGEQTIEARANQSLDELRVITPGFEEFGTDQMSQFAARCKQYGIEELFLIAMKIGDGKKRTSHGSELPSAANAPPVPQRRSKHR